MSQGIKFSIQGSWKQSLRNSFKNFRRDHPCEGASNKRPADHNFSQDPPTKRAKVATTEATADEDDDYESDLCTEWKKGKNKRSQALIRELLEKTARCRRRWITQENPLVSEVISRFPCLRNSRLVRIITK